MRRRNLPFVFQLAPPSKTDSVNGTTRRLTGSTTQLGERVIERETCYSQAGIRLRTFKSVESFAPGLETGITWMQACQKAGGLTCLPRLTQSEAVPRQCGPHPSRSGDRFERFDQISMLFNVRSIYAHGALIQAFEDLTVSWELPSLWNADW